MARIKIGYILTPIEFGGSERVNLSFLKNIDRDKYDICPVLLIRPWENKNLFIEELKKENYRIYQVPVAIRPRSAGRDYFRFIRCYRIVHSFLSKGSFDLVHTHGYFADTVGILAAKMLGIPNISTCHGFIVNDINLKLYNSLDRIILRLADKIIAVSDQIKEDLARSGIKKSRLITIQNAVNITYSDYSFTENRQEKRKLLNLCEGEFVVGYIGRLSEEKGVRHLIKACSLLDDSRFSVKLVLLGTGPQRQELESIVKKKKMEGKTFFAGFQNDIEKWLPVFDIFVLPSLTEGTPMALLEAMSTGIPVIASRVGGVPNIVSHGVNGFLFEAGNSLELVQLIKVLYDNPCLRNKMSAEAVNLVKKNHDVNNWCKVIQQQYELIAQTAS